MLSKRKQIGQKMISRKGHRKKGTDTGGGKHWKAVVPMKSSEAREAKCSGGRKNRTEAYNSV